MKRDLTKLGMTAGEVAKYGTEGEFYYPPKSNFAGQDQDDSIVDANEPPKTQHGLWCGWRYSKSTNCIKWDGGEKFYHYVTWLKYLIENILEPSYNLNGNVDFQGEDEDDQGTITVENNHIVVKVNGKKCTKQYLTSDHQCQNLLKFFMFVCITFIKVRSFLKRKWNHAPNLFPIQRNDNQTFFLGSKK